MPTPIADPFVENAISADIEALIDVRSEPNGVVTVVINGSGPSNALNGETARALAAAGGRAGRGRDDAGAGRRD